MVPIWIYVIINSDISNMLTENIILHDFRLRELSLSEAEFILTLFVGAIDSLKKEVGLGNNIPKFTTLTPYVVYTKTSVPDTSDTTGRTHSMMSQRNAKDNDGLIGSIKGLFNK
jgi:hypothetical protein